MLISFETKMRNSNNVAKGTKDFVYPFEFHAYRRKELVHSFYLVIKVSHKEVLFIHSLFWKRWQTKSSKGLTKE